MGFDGQPSMMSAMLGRSPVYNAMMQKNMKLKTRGIMCCCSVVELVLPVIFFGLMCLPKLFVDTETMHDQFFASIPVYSAAWTNNYGDWEDTQPIGYRVLYTPDTDTARQLTRRTLIHMLCDAHVDDYLDDFDDDDLVYDRRRRLAQTDGTSISDSDKEKLYNFARFPDFWESAAWMDDRMDSTAAEVLRQGTTELCAACFNNSAACTGKYEDTLTALMEAYDTEQEAVDASLKVENQRTAVAVVVYEGLDQDDVSYKLRTNGTQLLGSGEDERLNYKDLFVMKWETISPGVAWKVYYTFCNIQNAIDAALLELKSDQDIVLLATKVKAFPWLGYILNLGNAIAAIFFSIIMVFAFISSTVLIMKGVVMEKELRLREGMQMMGLPKQVYWVTWFVTHWGTLIITSFLCALIGMYPFSASNPVLMFIFYVLWSASLVVFCYALSTFFSRSKIAAIVSSIVFVGSMAPGIAVDVMYPYGDNSFIAVCLLPGSSIYMFGNALAILELGGYGVSMDTMNDKIFQQSDFTLASVYGMAILDIFLFSFITWYLDQVLPTQYGTREHPLFFMFKSYWFPEMHVPDPKLSQKQSSKNNDRFESYAEGKESAVEIEGLHKSFGGFTAVNGINHTFVKGEVSGLLGHNGAGKTTLISMLTGMLPPSSGTARINGADIRTNLAKVREGLGLVPQFDILWPTLTVREHLRIYAKFKGVAAADLEQEIMLKVQEVGLVEKVDYKAGELSGGQRRKLSLAIAFLGMPPTVFLDEPTSGMDPYSRRFCWNVIRKYSEQCSIILTTHFMDEADYLSDHITIMSHGKFICSGSSVFLKNRFGAGYNLTMVKSSSDVLAEPIVQLVKGHVDEALMATNVGTELSFKLPTSSTSAFPSMLNELDNNLQKLGIESYGVSCTTMEEVFLSLSIGNSATTTEDVAEDQHTEKEESAVQFTGGMVLLMRQFMALVVKRLINVRRDRLGILTQQVVPLLFVVLAVSMDKLEVEDTSSDTYDSLAITSALLDDRKTPFASSPDVSDEAFINRFVTNYANTSETSKTKVAPCWCFCPSDSQDINDLICPDYAGQTNTEDGSKATCVDVSDITVTEACSSLVTNTVDAYILDYAEEITPCNRAGSKYSCDALFVTDYVTESSEVEHATFDHTVYVSPTAYHPLPAGMRAASSALMRTLLGDKGSISVTSHPLPDPVWSVDEDSDLDNSMIVSIFIVIGVSVLSASFCVFLVWEKSNNAKHLQMVSGVNKLMFWATAYLCDFLIYLFVLIAIIIIFAAADMKAFKDDNLVACGMLFFFFGLSCIPLTYTLHFSFVSEMNALAFLMGSFFFFGLGTLLCNIILEAINNSQTEPYYEITEYLFRLLPHYCVSKGVYDIMQNHLRDSDKEKDVWDMHVTGAHILFMAIEAVVYFAITVLIEYNENSLFAFVARFTTPKRADFVVTEEAADDEDVAAEAARVKEGVKDTDSVVVKGLCKTYPTGKVAVQPMNVAMPQGECFGLLGINGAGKTTTFKMLTGEFGPTAGDAFVRGRATDGSPAPMLSIISDLNQARQVLGYCPQFDGIQPNMTAREHLWFYATIRGVEAAHIDSMCEALIVKMNLSQYADKMAGTYSGGNKRKLSVAIALVGNPPIVLLDEPSTGMDPEARRFMWDVISASMKGRAMVLTSHSMEECEALCHRVGIMVSGRFQCLGSVQHLKNRFSEGYMLDMRAKPEDIPKVIEGVKQQIGASGGVEVAEQHETHVKFRITAHMRLSQMFGEIEKLRQKANVVDYSLSQTTLEQVFVRFASTQTEETQLAPGLTDKGHKAVELAEVTTSQGVAVSHVVDIPDTARAASPSASA